MRKGVVLVMVLALLASQVSGCASIKNDATRTKTEGTLVGGAVGAAAGAGIGAAIGGGRGALIGAVLGAIVGSIGGHAYGTHVANEKARYANEEAWLDACLLQAEKTNNELRQYNKAMETEIAALDKKTQALQKALAAKQANKRELRADAKRIQECIKANNERIAYIGNEVTNQEKVLADAKLSHRSNDAALIEAEIAALRRHKAQLEETNKQLATMSTRISV